MKKSKRYYEELKKVVTKRQEKNFNFLVIFQTLKTKLEIYFIKNK